MREPAPTVHLERPAGTSGWGLVAIVFACFVAGFAGPRLLGGKAKPNASATEVPVNEAHLAPTKEPSVAAVVAPAAPPPASEAPSVAAPAVAAPTTSPVVASPSAAVAVAVPPETPASSGHLAKGAAATTLYPRTLVRDRAPEGEIVARIPQGTEVQIVERQNNWYHVKYGTNKEGWIYRKSIGR